MNGEQLVQHSRIMVMMSTQQGQTPIAFVTNAATRKLIGDTIKSHFVPSRWARLLKFLLKRPDAKLVMLHGIPVLENEHLPNGVISLQAAGIPIPGSPAQSAEQALGKVPENPFVKKEPVQPAEPQNEPIKLDDIAQNAQGDLPSITDVLIKALENVESLSHVVVIRKHRNNDVDMSMSCNQYEAVGIVQKAQYWLATHD